MGDQARVTVVIPAYKAEATIRRAVDSVLAQQGVDVETIVVVDGLLDDTAKRLETYSPERVKVLVNAENRGAQASRNRGLDAAGGEFVMFLDADDFIEGPLLRGMAQRLRDERADLCFGPMQRLREPAGRRQPVVHRTFSSPDELVRAWLGEGKTVNPSATLWRTDFLRGIGGWNPRVRRNQDGEVVIRGVLKGARVAVSSEGRGIYVIHASADRVTLRPENLPSAIEVGEILMEIPSRSVGEQARRDALAAYFARIALRLNALGRPDLARRALARAGEFGLRPRGRLRAHLIASRLIGIPFRLGLARLDSPRATTRLLLGAGARNLDYASRGRRLRSADTSS